METGKSRIAFCGVPEGASCFEGLFGQTYDVATFFRLKDATAGIDSEFDAIILGTQFDDGAMFDLLEWVKSTPQTLHIPVLCVRIAGGDLEPALYKAVSIAARANGAADFIDLFRWRHEMGNDKTDKWFKQAIEQLLQKN